MLLFLDLRDNFLSVSTIFILLRENDFDNLFLFDDVEKKFFKLNISVFSFK